MDSDSFFVVVQALQQLFRSKLELPEICLVRMPDVRVSTHLRSKPV